MPRKSVLDALFPKTRQALLSAFLLRPNKWWYLAELAKHYSVTPSSLQRELASLVEGDLLVSRKDGNRVYYKVNEECPVVEELQVLLVKTAGIADVLRASLKKFSDKIETAFIYGSVARAEELSTSDVDLMIIGDVRLSDLVSNLRKAEKRLGREINPTIYSAREFSQKLKGEDAFIKTVLAEKKIFVQGKAGEFEAVAG